MRIQNRKALKAFHPDTFNQLENLIDSPFQAVDQGLEFLNRIWPYQPEEKLSQQANAVVFGLPHPQELTKLLDNEPQRLLIVDSQPERAWTQLNAFDYSQSLENKALDLRIAPPQDLLQEFPLALQRFHDLRALEWRETQPATELAEMMNGVFLKTTFRDWKEKLTQIPTPTESAFQIYHLYEKLEHFTHLAYQTYPLSCTSGCSDCCKKDTPLLISLYPGEWWVMWLEIKTWPEDQQKNLADSLIRWAKSEFLLLQALFQLFDQNQTSLATAEFSSLQLDLIQKHKHTVPCFFLNQTNGHCQIYKDRPLTCRLFGASQYFGKQPYTCEKDWPEHEQILKMEGSTHRLVDADLWRRQLSEIQVHTPYKMPMALWLFTHLDPQTGNWLSQARFDYAQFQTCFKID